MKPSPLSRGLRVGWFDQTLAVGLFIRLPTDPGRTFLRGPYRADTPPKVRNYVTAVVENNEMGNSQTWGNM